MSTSTSTGIASIPNSVKVFSRASMIFGQLPQPADWSTPIMMAPPSSNNPTSEKAIVAIEPTRIHQPL